MAYDLLSIRDGSYGWKRGRAQFRADRLKNPEALSGVAVLRTDHILQHAFRTVPYYRETWKTLGFTDEAPPTHLDLDRLPLLTKDLLRSEREDLRSNAFAKQSLIKSATGGTTGVQTIFYMDRDCAVGRLGRQWGALESIGYRPGNKRGLVWGIHEETQGGNVTGLRPVLRKFASSDESLDCTLLDDDAIDSYVARLRLFQPSILYGYPSAMAHLAAHIDNRGLSHVPVERVVATAERLSDETRALLSRVFEAEVFNIYCTREFGCIAHECHLHTGMHIDIGSVKLEITREGRVVPPGQLGEITITDLWNHGMPLVRSRIGDLGRLSIDRCKCGSPFPLLRTLEGRSTDAILTPGGGRIAGLMLTDLFQSLPGIRIAQFYQDRLDVLEVRVIATDDFTESHERAAEQEVRSLVGDAVSVKMIRVADLPRNPRSGKIPEVVSTIGGERQ